MHVAKEKLFVKNVKKYLFLLKGCTGCIRIKAVLLQKDAPVPRRSDREIVELRSP